MRGLLFSCIGWDRNEDKSVARILSANGFTGVELVPGRVFERTGTTLEDKAEQIKQFWADFDLCVPTMQALLYGVEQTPMSEPLAKSTSMLARLGDVAVIGKTLGIERYVFGSPNTRKYAEGLTSQDSISNAAAFLTEVSNLLGESERALCLEVNPGYYGAEYLMTTEEVLCFIEDFHLNNIGFHLDTGACILNGEDVCEAIRRSKDFLVHIHLSEPDLKPLDLKRSFYSDIFETLREVDYRGYVAVEMKRPKGGLSELENLVKSLSRMASL